MSTQKTNRRKPNRKQPPEYPLNTPLPRPELLAILQAADEIIAAGGRTLLSKILKGSKEKNLLELGLDITPAYGLLQRTDDGADHGEGGRPHAQAPQAVSLRERHVVTSGGRCTGRTLFGCKSPVSRSLRTECN